MELLKNWICAARGSSWPPAQAGCILPGLLSQRLSLNQCGGNGRPEGTGRNSVGRISVHFIHACSPCLKVFQIRFKKLKMKSPCVSIWARKTVVFDSFWPHCLLKGREKLSLKHFRLGDELEIRSTLDIVVGCRQLIDPDREILKPKQPLIPWCLKYKNHVTSALPLELRL